MRCTYFGKYQSVAKTKHPKLRSRKVSKTCPSLIKIKITDDGIQVTWCKTHIGHEFQARNLNLNPIERDWLKSCFESSLTNKQIVRKVKLMATERVNIGGNFDRLHYLQPGDLKYYRKKFGFQPFKMLHTDDLTSVTLIVEELKNDSDVVILFYKPVGTEYKESIFKLVNILNDMKID